MKKSTIVEVISALLLVFYVHSVISIYIQLRSLKNVLAFYTPYASTVAWVILIVEFTVALFLFIQRTRVIGLLMSSVLVIIIAIAIFSAPRYPHDFGGVLNNINDKKKVILGAGLLILGIIALFIRIGEIKYKKQKETSTSVTVFT